MIIQLEDILDVLYVVFGTKYDILLLVYHSCGHDHMRPNALDVNSMNVCFGGNTATIMHSSTIKEKGGYIGPYIYSPWNNVQVRIGMEQSFFIENDIGPFYLNPVQRMERKHDKVLGIKKKQFKAKGEWRN